MSELLHQYLQPQKERGEDLGKARRTGHAEFSQNRRGVRVIFERIVRIKDELSINNQEGEFRIACLIADSP